MTSGQYLQPFAAAYVAPAFLNSLKSDVILPIDLVNMATPVIISSVTNPSYLVWLLLILFFFCLFFFLLLFFSAFSPYAAFSLAFAAASLVPVVLKLFPGPVFDVVVIIFCLNLSQKALQLIIQYIPKLWNYNYIWQVELTLILGLVVQFS